VKVYVDGGVKGHQQKVGRRGYISVVMDEKRLIEPVGSVTNNQAEYLALIKALRMVLEEKGRDVEVLSDSELLVKQIKGEYRVRNPSLQTLHREAVKLSCLFEKFSINWIPREQNLAGIQLENKFC
jgi:ribonuclease HI